jgi:hypothetical protein
MIHNTDLQIMYTQAEAIVLVQCAFKSCLWYIDSKRRLALSTIVLGKFKRSTMLLIFSEAFERSELLISGFEYIQKSVI